MLQNNLKNKIHSGYITLISVLVISAISVSITISVLLLGLSASNNSAVYEDLYEAKTMSDLCVEFALEQIRSDINYSGSNSVNIGNNSCSYTVNNLGGETRSISSEGISNNTYRRINLNISAINPVITISSWQEVP